MPPNVVMKLFETAAAHHRAGRLQEAMKLYAQVRAAAPNLAEAWQLGGLAAQQLDRHTESMALLERATRLSPKNHAMLSQYGVACVKAGRTKDGEKALLAALQLKPDHRESLVALAHVYHVLNRIDEAIGLYRRLTEAHPGDAELWDGLGTCHALTGHYDASLEAHERALAINPNHRPARFGRARALAQSHRVAEAITDYDRYLAEVPSDLNARSNRLFSLNYLDTLSASALHAEHLAYASLLEPLEQLGKNACIVFPNTKEPARPLRVAFLSPDLRKHSVAYFLYPLLQHLDKQAFELLLYHDHHVEDVVSAQLQKHCRQWRNFVGQSHSQVEKTIRADRPDILVDLAGHTGMNRMALYAKRLAPVQATYLGYPNTTGLKSMDYRLTDPLVDPEPEADAFATEKLLRFAPTAWSYTPPAEAPPVVPPPCIEAGKVTFTSFNALGKVNATTRRLWARVLEAVPGSRLLLKSFHMTGQAWLKTLEDSGIPAERLTLLRHTQGIAEHLACYGQTDIGLDPHPYNGTTTTCEALWMGVPVITLEGDRHSSRVGSSLLQAIGHPEWVARSEAAYIAKAVALASDPGLLASLRAGLRADMLKSPLLDQAGQAARFGKALRQMWEAYCSRP
jgi:predicted O-linked N-acetylglucosamine transferase (SPINDLY family)